jgi:hypothetical protein
MMLARFCAVPAVAHPLAVTSIELHKLDRVGAYRNILNEFLAATLYASLMRSNCQLSEP